MMACTFIGHKTPGQGGLEGRVAIPHLATSSYTKYIVLLHGIVYKPARYASGQTSLQSRRYCSANLLFLGDEHCCTARPPLLAPTSTRSARHCFYINPKNHQDRHHRVGFPSLTLRKFTGLILFNSIFTYIRRERYL